MKKKCYICGSKASSKEHVPPKSFFPENEKYRKQLITVPSCSKHNEDTSKDDQYTREIIIMSNNTNEIAFDLFNTKVIPWMNETPNFMNRILRNTRPIYVKESSSSIFRRSRTIEIEIDRFNRTMKKIACGLYFYEFGKPWEENLFVLARNLYNEGLTEDKTTRSLLEYLESSVLYKSKNYYKGANPKIFQYMFPHLDNDHINTICLFLIFYEKFKVEVFSGFL